ncbi:hypothetical protein [Albirhodobacter sp. R86504]|uniref:hypothetical protein n=1 Tax=Albirhodobacter sp. R86504 TaxID=3093848 RepID=UPI00366DD853
MAVTKATVTGPVYDGRGDLLADGRLIFTRGSWDKSGGALVVHGQEGVDVLNGDFTISLACTDGDRGQLINASYIYPDHQSGRPITMNLGQFALPVAGSYELGDILGAADYPPSTQIDALAAALAAAAVATAAASQTALDKLATGLSAAQASAFPLVGRDTLAELLADTTISYTAGVGKVVVSVGDTITVRQGEYSYEVVSAGTAAFDRLTATTGYTHATAGGVLLKVVGNDVPDAAFFTATNVDDTTGLQLHFDWCEVNKQRAILVQKDYWTTDTIVSRCRGIEGGTQYVDSGNPGTRIYMNPTVMVDLKPVIQIAAGMYGGGQVNGVSAFGNQSYTMQDAETWCPNPANLPAYTAFAAGPVGFEIIGTNQPTFTNCSTKGVKAGRLDNSTNGHIYSINSNWNGWMAGIYCKKNSEDYFTLGGSVSGLFAGYMYGHGFHANHYGGVAVRMIATHMGFSAYGFYEVNDATLPAGVNVSLSGYLDVQFEYIGEAIICQTDSGALQGLEVAGFKMSWSIIHDWATPASGWATNLHPSIKAYDDQQRYAMRVGTLTRRIVFKNGFSYTSALRRSPYCLASTSAQALIRVVMWDGGLISNDSDFTAVGNDIFVYSYSDGTVGPFLNNRGGQVVKRDNLVINRSGVRYPNLIKAPFVASSWTSINGGIITRYPMSDLAARPQLLRDEYDGDSGWYGYGVSGTGSDRGMVSALPVSIPAYGRVAGFSFWYYGGPLRARLALSSGTLYDTTYIATTEWTKVVATGRVPQSPVTSIQFFASADFYITLPTVFVDDVKPFSPSHAPMVTGSLATYANNTAAIAAGLPAGSMYMVTGSDPRQIAIVY